MSLTGTDVTYFLIKKLASYNTKAESIRDVKRQIAGCQPSSVIFLLRF